FKEVINGATRELEITKPVVCDTCEGRKVAPGSKMKMCSACSGSGQVRKVQNTILGQVSTVGVCDSCQGAGEIPEKVCETCNGTSRMKKTEKLSIKIPAGIDNGSTIRLSGKGEGGVNGGPAGDLYVHIQVKSDPAFKRNGSDIYTIEKIHIVQAVMGAEIDVKTVHGDVKLKIPTGTESHKMFKLSGYGLSKPGSSKKGDHFVEVHVDVPKKLSKKEKELYEKLAEEGGLDSQGKKKGFFS
ncbi:molecular chaperone DnaJ, partial [Candidatus Peregrinibacteria bacterium]|nr:molecular chaperone DnaJ [Candidatus Peregrinibacteria bacterium]